MAYCAQDEAEAVGFTEDKTAVCGTCKMAYETGHWHKDATFTRLNAFDVPDAEHQEWCEIKGCDTEAIFYAHGEFSRGRKMIALCGPCQQAFAMGQQSEQGVVTRLLDNYDGPGMIYYDGFGFPFAVEAT